MASSRMMAFDVNDDRISKEANAHIGQIAKEFCNDMADKYIVGQIEHGGDLKDLSVSCLLDEAIKEAIDQVVYLFTMRQKLREAVLDAGRNAADSL